MPLNTVKKFYNNDKKTKRIKIDKSQSQKVGSILINLMIDRMKDG